MERFKQPINVKNVKAKEVLPGIFRKTLTFGKSGMICHFNLKAESKIPMHSHVHAQMGYVLSGKVKFKTVRGQFIAKTQDSYYFISNESHGAEILENTELLDMFMPLRKSYLPTEENYHPNKKSFIRETAF